MSSMILRVPRTQTQNICRTAAVPAEILRLIFVAVVDDACTSWNSSLLHWKNTWSPSPVRSSLTLSHVSVIWRTVATGYSHLWRFIDLAHPRLTELCMNLSGPHNIEVVCRNTRNTQNIDQTEPLAPEHLTALEWALRESTRIECWRLSGRSLECDLYDEDGIMTIITRLEATFPNMKTFEIMDSNPRTASLNIDTMLKGAPKSIQQLTLPTGTISFDVVRYCRLVSLTFSHNLTFSKAEWRLLFNHLEPTLQYLDMSGMSIKNMDPPVVLSHLHTLKVEGWGQKAGPSIHAPHASRISLLEWHDLHANYDHDAAGRDFARAVNQRFRHLNDADLGGPFRLRYHHDDRIVLFNADVIFLINFIARMDAFSSFCRSLDVRLRNLVTELELEHIYTSDPRTGEEDVFDHSADYRDISIHLPNLKKISLDADSHMDFLLWWVGTKSHEQYSAVATLKISSFDCGDVEDATTLIGLMDWRAANGCSTHLILEEPYTLCAHLLGKGYNVTVED
jgi:hypothetical protein